MKTRLLLIGAGHAHVGVLADLARAPPAGVEVTLVTAYPRQIYSGMLPGWIAGHYALEQCAIAAAPLAARARTQLVIGRVTQLDLSSRTAITADGTRLAFDIVSIDTGAVLDIGALAGAREHGIGLRPIEEFIVAWQRLHAQFAAERIGAGPHTITQRPAALSVVGGGGAGVEVALAIAWRLAQASVPMQFHLVAGRDGVLPTLPARCRARVLRQLHRHGIHVIDADVAALEREAILLADGSRLESRISLVATGTAAAEWPRAAGLAVDGRGFIGIRPTHQSLSHPFVFAAGDCAAMIDHPRAKSGVYAVRAGLPLAANLRRALAGAALVPYVPQKRALYLLSTGGKHAIASWNGISFEGDWVWRWKDRIDRGFMARYVRKD
jgi:pyridine nucleotide-disulfide oxidoreductase family protein